MKPSPYERLEDDDVMRSGDEVRYDASCGGVSTQNADADLDESRTGWRTVGEYWVGRRFGEFRIGWRGKVDCRRRV